MRTTAELVAGIIEVDDEIDLAPFISAASQLVDIVDEESDLSETVLTTIETWLSAHFYTLRDPRPVHERAGSVAQTNQSKVDLGLATSHYGQMAMTLDTSGTLRRISRGQLTATVTWLGTAYE